MKPLIILVITGGVISAILLAVGVYISFFKKDATPAQPVLGRAVKKKTNTFSGPFTMLSCIILAVVIIVVYNDVTALNPRLDLSAPSDHAGPTSQPPTSIPTVFNLPKVAVRSASSCAIHGPYPDPTCTPGAILSVTPIQVCAPGYLASIQDIKIAAKNQVFAEYGVASVKNGDYEVDHFIPLELGGSNEMANLWPEAASPSPGFHEKDRVELYLKDQVCSGMITLLQAQSEIITDWVSVYNKITGSSSSGQNQQPGS